MGTEDTKYKEMFAKNKVGDLGSLPESTPEKSAVDEVKEAYSKIGHEEKIRLFSRP